MSRFYCLFVTLFLVYSNSKAQYLSIEVGIDGFTCSMCAMSTEKSLRQLSFVEEVKMDLNGGIAKLFLRKDKTVFINKVADKIEDAGFSVRYIHALYNFSEIKIENYTFITINKDEFCFINVENSIVKGLNMIIFLNKKLSSKKEYARWEEWIKKIPQLKRKGDNLYYVTLLRGQ